MSFIVMDANPYTINAISLVIIGLASTIYFLQIKEKSAPTWCISLGLASFTIGMLAQFFSSLVFWGGALTPLAEACSVAAMAAMLEFAVRYPRRSSSIGIRLVRTLVWCASAWALIFSADYLLHFRIGHSSGLGVPTAFWWMNPLTLLMAFSVSVIQTISIQNKPYPGRSSALRAFLQPRGYAARNLRNISLALCVGLVQGVLSVLHLLGIFPYLWSAVLISFCRLLMVGGIVYASFGFSSQQPGLVVRLVGLTLMTLMGVIGAISLYESNLLVGWILERNASVVANSRNAVRSAKLEDVPGEVVYILAWPQGSSGGGEGRLVYSHLADFDPRPLWEEQRSVPDSPAWEYYLETSIHERALAQTESIRLRYGNHPAGSYHQYIGYLFAQDGNSYEVGFSLEAMSRIIQTQNTGMVWGVLCSALFVIFIFPLFFQKTLIRPLDRLLKGVREADCGDLNVRVPVAYNDEVGFLTSAFNKMIASLKQELDGRQQAEAELRQLNLTLEERVSKRTRELEVLYDVTAASNQARDSQTLFTMLLERSLSALRSPVGFILLFDEQEGHPGVNLAASKGLPLDWQANFQALQTHADWVSAVMAQTEPMLIADTGHDERTPVFMRGSLPMAAVLAPLRAEDQALGILGMARPMEEKFDLDEVALLVSIVNQVGVAVHADRLRQLVQQAKVVEERQRLARDLHDSVTQSLYGLVTLTEVGLMRVEAQNMPAAADTYRKIGQTTRQAIREMRLFIHQLRLPELEQVGLVSALEMRLAAVEGHSDIQARLIAEDHLHLPLSVETAFYYIAQEALNNSLKHAHAANVTVTLRHDGCGVVLEVVDDGRGFNPHQAAGGGMGLANMQARAREIGASLGIASQPGQGTRVTVSMEDHSS